jgi:hypothetical protein
LTDEIVENSIVPTSTSSAAENKTDEEELNATDRDESMVV